MASKAGQGVPAQVDRIVNEMLKGDTHYQYSRIPQPKAFGQLVLRRRQDLDRRNPRFFDPRLYYNPPGRSQYYYEYLFSLHEAAAAGKMPAGAIAEMIDRAPDWAIPYFINLVVSKEDILRYELREDKIETQAGSEKTS